MSDADHQSLKVALDNRSYMIHIGAGLLAEAGNIITPLIAAPRVVIISDEMVAEHYMDALTRSLDAASISHQSIIVPAGEGSKSFASYEKVMNQLLALKADRKTTLIALGGGVVGDLCGFAASTLMRGVDFIQIPTSLLAQVDSSVGGKTGINTKMGKNLVGAFHQPRAVIIDINMLSSLSDREFRAGYAEIYKYGLIGNAEFADWLERNGPALVARRHDALIHAIYQSCQAKADIVAKDEREGGVRALLNLGHTFGHAFEAETGYSDELVHGEAVAIGTVLACRLSEKLKLIDAKVTQRVVSHLYAMQLPTSPKDIRSQWDVDALCQHMLGDKKADGGKMTFILLKAIGEGVVQRDVAMDMVRDVVKKSVA